MRVREQSDRHRICILAQLLPDQLCTAQHIGPLVVAAELHVAAIMLEHVVKVIALHDHVVELKEAQTLFHALFVALGTKHIVYGETTAYLSQQFHIVQAQKPIRVIQHHRFTIAEFNKAFHLPAEAVRIMGDRPRGEHFPHICPAGGIADHSGAAADQSDRLIPGHLETLHQRQGHEMPGSQAVSSTVEPNIKNCPAFVYQIFDFFLVCDLCDQASGLQFIIKRHQ